MPKSYEDLIRELRALKEAEEEAKGIQDKAEKEADEIIRKAELEASRLSSESEAEIRKERLRTQEDMEEALASEMAKLMDNTVEQRQSLRAKAKNKEAETVAYIMSRVLPKE